MSGGGDEIVRYRLSRARETLTEAELMAESAHWNGCVNRLYYACFYALTALLHQRGLASTKHTGVRALFNQHFVKPRLVERRLGAVFNELFDMRHEGDYEDLRRFDENAVQPFVPCVEQFIDAVERLATARK